MKYALRMRQTKTGFKMFLHVVIPWGTSFSIPLDAKELKQTANCGLGAWTATDVNAHVQKHGTARQKEMLRPRVC